MEIRRVQYLPTTVAILLLITFIVTYALAVAQKHVAPLFPYISETANLPPEANIFSQALNVAALLLLLTVYIRHQQVSLINNCQPANERISKKVNTVSSSLGVIAAIGMDLVANFQEKHVISVHLIGAFLCFGLGTLYLCIQTWFSRRLRCSGISCTVLWIRILLSTVCVVFSGICVITAGLGYVNFRGDDRMQWKKEDGGWVFHVASAFSEWIVAFSYCFFLMSFHNEFKNLAFVTPMFRLKKIVNGCEITDIGEDENKQGAK